MKTFLLACVVLLLTFGASAQQPQGLSDSLNALDVLLQVRTFSDSAVGAAGTTPPSVKALRTLLKDPQADAAFKFLLARGSSVVGRLYALCGLYFTDFEYFKVAIESYRTSRLIVETDLGCFGGKMTVAELVESHAPNALRLKGPKQSLEEGARHFKDGFQNDILGGAYPNLFRRE